MLDLERAKLINQDRTFTAAFAAMAAVYVALFLYFVERASIRVPVYDLLDWLLFYGDRARVGDWYGYLWTPHSEHRLVLSRLLLAVDVNWFGGRGTAFAASGLALHAAVVASICWTILKTDLPASLKAAAIPLAVFLLTPAYMAALSGMPAMGVFLQTCAFAVFSLLLLDGGSLSAYRRPAALATACLAAFGVSAGLLIWPVLLWSAWRGGLGWRWLAAVVGVGVLFSAFYMWRLPTGHLSPSSFEAGHIVRSFDYTIRFLGLPWSQASLLAWPARFIGLGILAAGALLLVDESRSPRPSGRLPRIGLALVLFALITAITAGFVRAEIGTDREMPIRYAIYAALAQVGFLLYALPFLQKFWPAYRRQLQWLMLAVFVVLLAQQIAAGELAAREADRYNGAWSRFVAGEWTPDMQHYVYPDRDTARVGLARLREMHVRHVE